jgi:hypothetical protein
VHDIVHFESIEIMDYSQPYPTLMGLELEFDNQDIINLKRREMIFEVGDLKVTAPLDLTEGKRYVEPPRGNNIDMLYTMIVHMDHYVKPIAYRVLSWRSISSCASDSEEGLEHWKHRMHGVSTILCACIT